VRKLREGVLPTIVWGVLAVLGVFAARAGWNAIYADWERNGQTSSAAPARSASPDIRTTAAISTSDTNKPEAKPYTTFAEFTLPAAGTSGKSVGEWVAVPEGTHRINWGTDDPDPNEVDTEIEMKLRDGRLIGPVPISKNVIDIRVSDVKALRASNKRPATGVTVTFRAAR